MTVSTQILSVLSLDSYGREINAGLIDPTSETPGLQGNLGSISYLGSSRDFLPATGSGFYATVYSVNGEIVIAFRGTDGDGDLAEDALFVAGQVGPQTQLAFELYETVRAAYPTSSIVLTGHSLGGALAGTVAAVRGLEAVIFDNVGFEGVAHNIHQMSIDPEAPPGLAEAFYGEGNTPSAPDFTDIHTTAIWGERAQPSRLFQTTPQTYYDVGDFSTLSADELHAQALLVIRLYMETSDDWKPASESLWDSFFSNDLAASVGITAVNGNPANGVMHDMIAYSTIGAGPFGDKAASSFRSDANTLGSVLNIDYEFDGQWLADATVGFASFLARSPSSSGNGVLDFAPGLGPDSGWISVDLSPDTWAFGMELAALATTAREAIVMTVFEPMEASLTDFLEFSGAAEMTYSAQVAVGAIDFVASTLRIPNFTLIIGAREAETLQGGAAHEIILGTMGEAEGQWGDTIDGGAGLDIIIGTDSLDILSGGMTNDPDGFMDFAWGRGGFDSFDDFYFADGGSGGDTFKNVLRAQGGSGDDTFIDVAGLAWGGSGEDTFRFTNNGVIISLYEDTSIAENELLGANLNFIWDATAANLLNVDSEDVLEVNGQSFTGIASRVAAGYHEFYIDDDLIRYTQYTMYDAANDLTYALSEYGLGIYRGFNSYSPTGGANLEFLVGVQGFRNGDFGINLEENDSPWWDYWNMSDNVSHLGLQSEEGMYDFSGGPSQADLTEQQWSEDWIMEFVNPPPPPPEEYF